MSWPDSCRGGGNQVGMNSGQSCGQSWRSWFLQGIRLESTPIKNRLGGTGFLCIRINFGHCQREDCWCPGYVAYFLFTKPKRTANNARTRHLSLSLSLSLCRYSKLISCKKELGQYHLPWEEFAKSELRTETWHMMKNGDKIRSNTQEPVLSPP